METQENERLLSRRVNILSAVFLSALGLFFLVYTLISDYQPDSKAIPIVLSLITIFASATLVIATIKGKFDNEQYDFSKTKSVLWFAITLIIYVILVYFIGYYIATFLFCSYTMWATGYRKIKTILIISIVLPILVYFFFETLFSLRIPHGMIFDNLL